MKNKQKYQLRGFLDNNICVTHFRKHPRQKVHGEEICLDKVTRVNETTHLLTG